jgi:anti-anti-sigma regulatory factor
VSVSTGRSTTRATRLLVVDLARVTFRLDDPRRAREAPYGACERGGELQIVYPPHPASRIFELTGLDAVFPAARLEQQA